MSSDSDDDLLQVNNVNHVLLQNEDTVFSTKGPPNLSRNISGFRSNVLTSTMQIPNQSVHQRYGGPNFDQWSMYRRETSPMSLQSVPNTRSCNFSHFDNISYQNGMGYQRFMSSRRRASPASLRSVDTTTSVSAADIVFALKNAKFNKYDLRNMKEAFHHLFKSNRMQKIRKRKKLVLKSLRRKYGEDSGEQGSDSSSSDDCRSVKTICNKNLSGFGYKSNVSHIIKHRDNLIQNMHMYNIIENPLVQDCSDQIKQNTLRSKISTSSSIINTRDQVQITQNHTDTQINDVQNLTINNKSVMTQKDRFNKGYLIPSQRFNKTAAGQTRFNDIEHNKIRAVANKTEPELLPDESNSDSENIFNNISVSKRDTLQDINNKKKRTLTTEDVLLLSEKNKKQLHSPKRSTNCGPKSNYKPNDFNFVIPNLPFKKGKPNQALTMSSKKCKSNEDTVPETLLAQSHVHPIVEEDHIKCAPNSKSRHIDKENGEPVEINILSDPLPSTSDVSMRPSFIKRKLFSQKLDDAEIKNVSSDSIGERQQNVYSAPLRERNKAKKIVTSHSCLSRDVQGDTNDVLDLIHKIVPPDKMNITNVNRKTNPCKSNSKNVENTHRWDVTSVLANCDSQDISDTYTDEEIFTKKHDEKVEKKKNQNSSSSKKKLLQCKVVVTKMNTMDKNTKENVCGIASKGTTNKKTVKEYVKNFWGTDLESDIELNVPNQETFYQNRANVINTKESSNKEKAQISNTTRLPTVRKNQNFDKESASSNAKIIDKQVIEISQPYTNRGQERTKNGRTNTKPNDNKEKDVTSHNIAVNSNKEESGKKQGSRNNVNCKTHKRNDTCNETKVSRRLPKTSISNSKDSKVVNPTKCNLKDKQNNKDATNKNINPNQHFNANKPSTQTASNVRVQPKRKSKENSFVEKHSAKRSKSNNVPITKALKESASKSISSNSPSFTITRHRKKIFSSFCDWNQSNLDLSNVSDRSLRYLQRVKNKNVNSN